MEEKKGLLRENRELRQRLEQMEKLLAQCQKAEGSTEEPTLTSELLALTGALVAVLDREGRIIGFNRACEEATGYTFAEVKNKPFWDIFLSPEEKNGVKDIFNRLASAAMSITHDNYWVTREGNLRLFAWSLTSVVKDEEVKFVIKTGVDITEREVVEKHIAHLASFPQLDPDPILELDLSRRVRFSNAAALKTLERLGTPGRLEAFLPADMKDIIQEAKRTGKSRFWREITVGDAVFSEIISFPPDLGVTRIYALDITERRRVEELLGQTQERLVRAEKVAHLGHWDLDLKTNELTWSQEVFRLFGRDPTKFVPIFKAFVAAVHPEDRDRVIVMRNAALQDAKSFTIDYRIVVPDGSERVLQEIVEIIRDEAGNPIRTFGIVQDITERKRAEQAQREIEARLQGILDNSSTVIFLKDLEGRYITVNRRFEGLFHVTRQTIVGKSDHDIFPRENANRFRQHDLLALEKGGPFEVEELFPQDDGPHTYISVKFPLIGADGKACAVCGIATDITERKLAEENLRASEEKFRAIFDHANDGILLADTETLKFAFANKKICEMLGYSIEEIQNLAVDDIHPRGILPHVMEQIKKHLSGETPYSPELPVQRKDGSVFYADLNSAPMMLAGKRYILGIFRDITVRKEAEEEKAKLEAHLVQAQKMEAIGTLAAGIAHDFNNILTAILGNIGLAALDSKIGPRVKDRLAQAEAACSRAQALSQQLLTFAKGGAPVKKLFSVAELLTESTAFTCVGSPVKCETTFPENLWWIEADPGQIGQVFQNLTINAIQAMPNGGTIKVWAENLTLETGSELPLSAGRYIKISVRDQGTGIPAEHLPRIFDPYFTTKQKGSGLGLASTYAIIKNHHGHIAVESKSEVGTTFSIYLPAVYQQSTPQPAEGRALLVGTGKILVMDDEEMVREVLGGLLARLGYESEFARDGGEAIEMLVQAQGLGHPFAAVILDLTVPGAMGGKETMARLLEIDPRVKAIVSSGYSDDPIMADFQKYGFSGVIAKPYKISELGKILNQVIMKKA